MKKYTLFTFLFASFVFFSCKKEEYKAPVSNTVNMAGRWWTELRLDDNQDGIFNEEDGDELIYAYEDFGGIGLVTSNTAANTADSVIINDPEESWPFKIKAPINYGALTFLPASVPNMIIEEGIVNIISGKILKGAAHSKSGAVVDSIFIEFQFIDSQDDDAYYMYSGHRDTGQPEDSFL